MINTEADADQAEVRAINNGWSRSLQITSVINAASFMVALTSFYSVVGAALYEKLGDGFLGAHPHLDKIDAAILGACGSLPAALLEMYVKPELFQAFESADAFLDGDALMGLLALVSGNGVIAMALGKAMSTIAELAARITYGEALVAMAVGESLPAAEGLFADISYGKALVAGGVGSILTPIVLGAALVGIFGGALLMAAAGYVISKEIFDYFHGVFNEEVQPVSQKQLVILGFSAALGIGLLGAHAVFSTLATLALDSYTSQIHIEEYDYDPIEVMLLSLLGSAPIAMLLTAEVTRRIVCTANMAAMEVTDLSLTETTVLGVLIHPSVSLSMLLRTIQAIARAPVDEFNDVNFMHLYAQYLGKDPVALTQQLFPKMTFFVVITLLVSATFVLPLGKELAEMLGLSIKAPYPPAPLLSILALLVDFSALVSVLYWPPYVQVFCQGLDRLINVLGEACVCCCTGQSQAMASFGSYTLVNTQDVDVESQNIAMSDAVANVRQLAEVSRSSTSRVSDRILV